MSHCVFCDSVLRGTTLQCCECRRRTCSITCLEMHSDLEHELIRYCSTPKREGFLAVAMLCLLIAVVLFLWWFPVGRL